MGDFDRDGGSDRRRSGGFRGRDSGRSRGRDSGRGGFSRGRSGGSDRRSGGSSGRDMGRDRDRYSERHEMHQAICDKCGKDCEVPFKPTSGKPLYCDDCFRDKSREAGSRSEFGRPSEKPSDANFDQVNKKLDKILRILEAKPVEEKEKPELKNPKKEEKPKKTELPDLEEPKSIEEEKPKKKKAKKKK